VKPRLIVIGPLPPPHHGVTVSTTLVLSNEPLHDWFEVEHLDTSDHRSLDNIGRWELRNLLLGIGAAARFAARLRGRRGVVYLPVSEGTPGFLRDSVFVHAAALARWRVAIHFRSGGFRDFYASSNWLMRAWIRLTLGQITAAAVLGEPLRKALDGLLPAERIAIAPNGTPDISRDGIPRDPETVLFLSNLRRRKGIVEAFEAALTVVSARPTARFLFVGSWEDRDLERELHARAVEAGDAIRFLPPVDGEAKRALLLSSSILLFPPVEPEGHPRVVLEALAAGLPVVTTDRGAIPETVIDGESGFVLPQPDPEKLADRLLRLLGDPGLREQIGKSARSRYLAHFTQEAADRRLADWLLSVAEAT
jgi:glycosyltransferase involved in cell wall biosynthesis